jgi:hypothetical protein
MLESTQQGVSQPDTLPELADTMSGRLEKLALSHCDARAGTYPALLNDAFTHSEAVQVDILWTGCGSKPNWKSVSSGYGEPAS